MPSLVRSRGSIRRRGVVIAVAVALAASIVLRVVHVHNETWEHRLFPSSTPPKVVYHQRDYRRAAEIANVESGFVRSGKTMGGGRVYAPAGRRTPTVIDVSDGHRIVAYSLMGGP